MSLCLSIWQTGSQIRSGDLLTSEVKYYLLKCVGCLGWNYYYLEDTLYVSSCVASFQVSLVLSKCFCRQFSIFHTKTAGNHGSPHVTKPKHTGFLVLHLHCNQDSQQLAANTHQIVGPPFKKSFYRVTRRLPTDLGLCN